MATTTTAELALPPINREMKDLDRSFFKKTVQTSALTVFNPRDIQRVRAKLTSARDILSATNIKTIIDDKTHPGAKCVLLRPHVVASEPSTWKDAWKGMLDDGTAKIKPYDLTITYDDWTMSDILDAILPQIPTDEEQNPSGFAQVGHVAHVNLREQFLPYKTLIGQVLLDKNPNIRTVINKVRDVGAESVFRTFPYEVLAGPDDLDVTISHAGCEFKFNFGDVYWNTRNGTEQERLMSQIKEGEVVCDITAGVGPFAIPLAKKKVWVWANDLNPACYAALNAAAKHNKVLPFVRTFNLDGSQFIRETATELLKERREYTTRQDIRVSRGASQSEKDLVKASVTAKAKIIREPQTFDHYISNLPATGIEFLCAFRGIYRGHDDLFLPKGDRKLPMIHTYTFQARKDSEEEEKIELVQRLSEYLGYALGESDEIYLHRARLVSPKKLYYCASFRLPAAVAFATSDIPT